MQVRLTAMRCLSRLEPSALVQHAADVVQKLVVQTLNHEHELELVDQSQPTGMWVAPAFHSGAGASVGVGAVGVGASPAAVLQAQRGPHAANARRRASQ